MNKTVDAIKYGLETLNISPKGMFSLIESSKGYTGTDYNRWLANEIIKIAEKDEVGYSQLLAKWFNIIQSMVEEHIDEAIRDEFVEMVKGMCSGEVYTMSISADENPYGTELEIDWTNGLDLPFNCEFIEGLPDGLGEKIMNGKPLTFLFRFGADGKVSGSSLIPDAKSNGVVLKSYDALLLYRVCSMFRALGDEAENLSVVIICDTRFLYDPENADLIKYVLSYVHYEGIAVDSKDLYETSFTNESYAILKCTALGASDEIQDGIVLTKLSRGGVDEGKYRYSRGSDMWETLLLDNEVAYYTDEVYGVSESGEIMTNLSGVENSIGYLCNSSNLRVPVVSTLPIAGSEYVAINEENFHRCLAFYGVVSALRGQRQSSDIGDIMTGHPDYMNLVGNCLPLLLFSTNSIWCDVKGTVEGEECEYSLRDFSQFIIKELESLGVYFSYETKELMEIGKKIWGDTSWGTSFREALEAVGDTEVNKAYLNAVSRCQTYVCSLYKAMA